MLRPANDALKHRKLDTLASVAVLAMALLVPCVLALAAALSSEAAHSYLRAYRPVVYLQADAEQATGEALAEELAARTSVAEATLRTPEDALETLEQRLGSEEVAHLGISASMLPYSIVLEPALPVLGHLDLIAGVSGLQARAEVASVDLPSPQAARTLSFVRWLLVLAGAALIVLVLAALGQLRLYLMCLMDDHKRESHLLAVFGAPPSRLRRPTLMRGISVGLAAGVAAFGVLFILLLLWQNAREHVIGPTHVAAGFSWVVVAAPIILGPLAGLISGWLANRATRRQTHDGRLSDV
jgi:cell division transport system permease protein